MKGTEQFGSRMGMMLAMLGMAVGTGNIWRFPRIAAKNGGGEFLIAWVVFLLLWSIPLILLEFGLGRKVRCGHTRAFMKMMGPRWAWMGAFTVMVGTLITFYYSVVAGWTVSFTFASITGDVSEARPGVFWQEYSTSWWPVLSHGVVIGLTSLVVARGVKSIEKVARILMPALLILILILVVRALTLPGAADGLSYLFTVDWENLGSAKLWLEALTQNAWDTGAGFGLVLCYAVYLRPNEDTALNGLILPTANNFVSLLAGIMVICTVFSVVPQLVAQLETDPMALQGYQNLADAVNRGEELTADLVQTTIFEQDNVGLTFIWMPQLFGTLPFGRGLMVFFFLALSFAAFTSMVAMVEAPTRALVDAGVSRKKAISIVGSGIFLLGLPSVFSMSFLQNQDWVWGVALMLSGLFFAISVIANGVRRFREEQLNHEDSDIRIGRWWDLVIGVLVPIQAVALLVWVLLEARNTDPENWLEPFAEYNVGTVLCQFALVLSVLILLNKWIVRKMGDGT